MALLEATVSESTIADELAVTAALVQRSTVHVRSHGRGAGSGVVWRSDGLIITNAHVANGPTAGVELWDGRSFDAQVIARNPQRDLAAIRIEATDLPAATILDSEKVRVGQLVAAVGNPLGLSGALTLGILHAIAPSEGHGDRTWIQADIRLAPGNSGGPLVDVQGQVIGINSMIAGGLGLAVPSNAVRAFLGERGSASGLGITLQPVTVPVAGVSRPGALLLQVAEGSRAQEAGLMIGDVLIGISGRPAGTLRDLLSALHNLTPDQIVRLDVLRGGSPVSVTLASTGDSTDRSAGAAA